MEITKFQKSALIILIFSILSSCHVMLIGAYDQITDQSFQKIQTEISALIIKIEKNIQNNTPAENSYANLKNDYITIEADVKSLQIRCSSIPKYNIIASQIQTISDNVQLLEQFNTTPPGFTSLRPVQIIDSTFTVQFTEVVALQNGLKSQKN